MAIVEALAFAPEILRFKFVQTATRNITGYAGERQVDKPVVEAHVFDFLQLPILWVPGKSLDYVAWNLILHHKITPPDSYHLACAIVYDAELWISHEHRDGFAEHARAVHDKVFTLTKDDFNVRLWTRDFPDDSYKISVSGLSSYAGLRVVTQHNREMLFTILVKRC